MADATRAEVIKWCLDKMCDFREPVFPPPDGWAWADSGDRLVLTPIFTMTDQGDNLAGAEIGIADISTVRH